MKLLGKKFFKYVVYKMTDTSSLKKFRINRQYDIFNISDYYENINYINFFKNSSLISDLFPYNESYIEEALKLISSIIIKKKLKFYIFFKTISISREMKISSYNNFYFIDNYELYIIYISDDEKSKVFKRFDGKIKNFYKDLENIIVELENLEVKLYKKMYNYQNLYGYKECVLDSGVTTLLIHECFGHLFEKDTEYFKKNYNNLYNRLSKCNLFLSDYSEGENIVFPIKIDDLGYISKNIKLCEYGKFKNYLSNGNYKIGVNGINQIRMNNFILNAGKYRDFEIINSVEEGLYLTDEVQGMVDCNGNFKVYCDTVYLINNGKLSNFCSNGFIQGNIFYLIDNVEMVGDTIKWRSVECEKNRDVYYVGGAGPMIKIFINYYPIDRNLY